MAAWCTRIFTQVFLAVKSWLGALFDSTGMFGFFMVFYLIFQAVRLIVLPLLGSGLRPPASDKAKPADTVDHLHPRGQGSDTARLPESDTIYM